MLFVNLLCRYFRRRHRVGIVVAAVFFAGVIVVVDKYNLKLWYL